MDLYPNAAGDADLTERVILEAATPVGVLFYVVDFMFLAVMSTTFVLGGYPSASPDHEISFMIFRTHTKINSMSIFARFM
jgi:hypothetical protein